MNVELKKQAKSYLRNHATGMIVTGIFLVVCGFFGLFAGAFTGFFAIEAFGIVLVMAGIAQFIQSRKQPESLQNLGKVVLAFFYILAGVIIAFVPFKSAGIVDLILGVFFIISGISKSLIAAQLTPKPGQSWLFASAGVSTLLGIFVVSSWPLGAIEDFSLSGFLISLELVLTGSSALIIGWTERAEIREEDKIDRDKEKIKPKLVA